MKDILVRLRELEREVSAERGPFDLFGLFLREDAPDVWDVVVAAPWASTDRLKAIEELAVRVRDKLTRDQMRHLSSVVVLDEDNPALDTIGQLLDVEHGMAEVRDTELFTFPIPIRQAYVITSRRRAA